MKGDIVNNNNGYDNFNNTNSFNSMNNNQGQYVGPSQGNGGSKFFNDVSSNTITPPDEMVGPNPFDMIRSYEEAFNNESNNSVINQPLETLSNQASFQDSVSVQATPISDVQPEPVINNLNVNSNSILESNPINPTPIEDSEPVQSTPVISNNIQSVMPEQSTVQNNFVQNTVNPLEEVVSAPEEAQTENIENSTPETFSVDNVNQSSTLTDTSIDTVPNVKKNVNDSVQVTAESIDSVSTEIFNENIQEDLSSTQEPDVNPDVVPSVDLTSSFNTDEFEARFGVNYDNAISKNEAIYKGLKYRITVLSEILIRLEYSESGTFEDRPTELARFRAFDVPKVLVTDEEKMLTLKTSYFELTYEKEKPFTGTKFSPDQYLKIKLLDTDKTWFFGHAEARNFKSTCSNLDDKSSIPKLEKGLYSTDGFVSLDDSESLIFNKDGSVGKRSDERIDTYLFLYKKDFGFCLKDFYRLTGYPPLIPRYALGVWWNRDEEYDTNGVYSLLAKFRKYEIPISVLLLNHWSKNDVTFDKEKIPSPENLINNIHSDDIKLGIDLKLSTVPSNQNGTIVDTPFNVYDRGFMANYFNSIIKPLNEMGVDFYSINYRGNDMSILRMINYYFYKYMNSEPDKRGMILSRNGLINSHLYPINNSGETVVDWKTLKMLPEFNSTGSNLGISWWSHAIGGFKDGIEESELYTRFVQLGTYSPIFRFSSKGGHYYKREPWRWDVKTRKIVKDYTNLRHKMIPYLYSEAYKYSRTGLPLVQPLYYRYPELYDEPTYKNEYYFGTELFIAPITERKDPVMNRTVTKLFLPNGMWYDFKTGKKFPGGKRYISFFQDEDYPVFAKQGAIIPEAIIPDEKRNFTGNPDAMEIHIFPGKNNTYKLYEDDGSTNAYKSGNFMTTSIDYNYLPNNYTVIIRPLEGKEGIVPSMRSYKIRFRNTRFADDVIAYLGSERIQVKMVLDDQDFIVETEPISTKEQLSINCKGKDIEIDAVRIINDDIDTIISDLKIPTKLKEEVASIMFSEEDIKKKRIEIRKLSSHGLNDIFVKMFLKLLEYIGEF